MRVGIALFFQNYVDWERFDALERGEQVGPMQVDDAQVWREQLAIADLVEPLGFDSIWTFEHHASPYIMLPNPQQQLAFFAGRTSRISMGSMVTVLPWHNPVRLAENISILQHQLGPDRRFILGIGRGLGRREFKAMGVDMAESRDRLNEVLEVLRLALNQEIFSYDGKYFQYESVSVRPRPLDPSVVENVYGVWTSEGSKQNAAVLGLHPLTTPTQTLEDYKRDLEDFDAIRSENGHGPANAPILQLLMYCAESEQQAQESAEKHFGEYVDSALRSYELGGSHFAGTKGYESYTGAGQSAFGSGDRQSLFDTLYGRFMNDAIYGTPDQCLEKVAVVRELMGPQEVVLVPANGTMTAEQCERSIRLFADKVLPRIPDLASSVASTP